MVNRAKKKTTKTSSWRSALRSEIDALVDPHAHPTFEETVRGLPPKLRGARVRGFEHSIWQLLEHIRIAQWDILEYSLDPRHESPKFPDGYWPKSVAPESERAWTASVKRFVFDRLRFVTMLTRRGADPLAPIAHAPDASLLGQFLLAQHHTSYHLGQIVMLRKRLGAWQ
jgi:hypothetical protein